MSKLNELSLSELRQLAQRESFSAAELVSDCLQRISARETEVGAFTHFDADQLLTDSKITSHSVFGAGLDGIPFGVKDIMDTFDMPTGWGSPIYKGNQPPRDAGCVASLRATGAIVAGKTVTTEFAYFFPGKTRNPLNLEHTPGGSSQGSAAAVADFMLPFALGTQTAASVIRPAAFCGIVGYKSSHGAFDLGGICSLSQSMDSLGFFVRDVRDLAIIRTAMLNQSSAVEALKPQRVGFVRTPHWSEATKETRELIESIVDAIQNNSIDVIELEVGSADGALTEMQKTIMAYEVARSRIYEYRVHRDKISPQITALIDQGIQITAEEYQRAKSLVTENRILLAKQFETVDCLITPSAIGEAPTGIDSTGDPLFSRMWNVLGGPSISLPAGYGSNRLPLGLQLVGCHNNDDALIAYGAYIQERIVRNT